MLTALALTLLTQVHTGSSTYGVHLMRAELLTRDQMESVQVERLSRIQLHAEEQRLTDDMPSIVGPTVMLALGGAAMIGFGILTYELFYTPNYHGGGVDLLGALAGILTGVLTAAGAAVGIAGGVLLGVKSAQRDTYYTRLQLVHARMDAMDRGAIPDPGSNDREMNVAQRHLIALEAKKPGLGLPISLMSCGAGGLLFGTYLAVEYAGPDYGGTGSTATRFILPIVLLTLGAAAEGIGIWQLLVRIPERNAIDSEIRDLERSANDPSVGPPPPTPLMPDDSVAPPPPMPPPPPPGAMRDLPPLPVAVSWTFRI